MSEIIRNTKNKINNFLTELEQHELIKFPNHSLLQLFQESERRAEFEVMANNAFVKINKIYNTLKQRGEDLLPENEYVAMNKLFHVYSMQASAEELKIYLKAIIDPSLINPDITELGKYLSTIYDQLEYSGIQRQEMNKVLFIELRNALGHLDYDITLESFRYRNKNHESFTISNEQFIVLMNQYNAIVETINEYIVANRSRWSA